MSTLDAVRTCSFCKGSQKNAHTVELQPYNSEAAEVFYFCPCCDRCPDGPVKQGRTEYCSSNAQHGNSWYVGPDVETYDDGDEPTATA